MEQENSKLDVVHQRDLDKLLKRMGIFEDIAQGKKKCKFCERVVDRQNLYSVLPESGAVNVVCDAPECITALLAYLDEKNLTRTENE